MSSFSSLSFDPIEKPLPDFELIKPDSVLFNESEFPNCILLSPAKLIEIFGKPLSNGDQYKVSSV